MSTVENFGFTVEPEDQLYAKRQDRYNCAIVRAIQREHPEALYVRADTEVIAFSDDYHRYEWITPKRLVEKVIKPFDIETAPMDKPMSFRLGPPAKITQREVRDEKRQAEHRKAERVRKAKRGNMPGNRSDYNRFCESEEGAE